MLNNFSLLIFKFQYIGLELIESERLWKYCNGSVVASEQHLRLSAWCSPVTAIPQLTCFIADDKNTS